MSAVRNIRMLTRYNKWANDMVLNAIAQLPSELVYQKRTAAFGGIIYTLGHMHIVDQIWQSHLLSVEHGYATRTTENPGSLEELTQQLRILGDWFIHYADTMNEAQLIDSISFSFVGGGLGQMLRGDILLHVCNHKTLHRGHIGDMFYQSGFKPPSIDLPVFIRDAWVEEDLNI